MTIFTSSPEHSYMRQLSMRATLMLAGVSLVATGCGIGSGPEKHEPAPVESQIPSDIADVEISAEQVAPGPTGEFQDIAMDSALSVSDIIADTESVQPARDSIAQIPNVDIQAAALAYVDSRLASNVVYADQKFYTHDDTEIAIVSIDEAESRNDLIRSTDIRSLAERQLDAIEAIKSVEAAENAPSTKDHLLDNIEDVEIQELAKQALDNNEQALDDLKKIADEAKSAINEINLANYRALYDGSNRQAEWINQEIANFTAARN